MNQTLFDLYFLALGTVCAMVFVSGYRSAQ